MSCFKGIFLVCASHKRRHVAPKVSQSSQAHPRPIPVLHRAPSVAHSVSLSPVKLTRDFSNKTEYVHFSFDNKEGPSPTLHRLTSTGRARGERVSDFAWSKSMSSKDMRSGSRGETPRMQRSASKGPQPILLSTSSGLLKPLPEELVLECTLGELCFGCVKQVHVSRAVASSTGLMSKEEEVLTVNVKPGWGKGTTITFPGGEDKEARSHSGDIVLVVVEKEHEWLKRGQENEEDLEVEIGVPLVDAISGCCLCIPLVDGGQGILVGDDIIEPESERVLKGQGMPRKKDPTQRGDLKVKFRVVFPESLTDSQRSQIVKILGD